MSKIYLPYAEQFDLMNENLMRIASAIGSDMDISTWAGIQKAVRAGVAPSLIPVGTQLSVSHSVYGDQLYDVVAHDHFRSAHDANAHTMTLMSHDIRTKIQFDSPEAFYYAEEELPAGTYHFTLASAYSSWAAGTYQFTLTTALNAGGQLCISDKATTALTSLNVVSYSSRTTTTATESVGITLGSDGTSLGTFGIELNHVHRISYGSNNYKESAIRQFLNSSAETGVWEPQTKFDRPPTWVSDTAGLMNGFDSDFLAAVGEVVVPCSANGLYESPDSTIKVGEKYTVEDSFYLASYKELFGISADTVSDDSTTLNYYADTTNTDRIKYTDNTASYWWTRTPLYDFAYNVRRVLSTGEASGNYASASDGVAVMFTIA